MPTSKKESLMAAIVSAVENTSTAKDVKLWPARIPQESLRRSWVAIFDGAESTTIRNKLAFKKFTLHLEAYGRSNNPDETSPAMDNLHAEIQSALLTPEPISSVVTEIEETDFEKMLIDDMNWLITNDYVVQYAHERGKPF